MLLRDDVRGTLAFHKALDSPLPCVIKRYAIDRLKNVNAKRGKTNLEDGCRFVSEIAWRQAFERCAVSFERTNNRFAVLYICSYEDVEISGGTRLRVHTDR